MSVLTLSQDRFLGLTFIPDFMQVTQNVFISWILGLTHLEGKEREEVWHESMFGVRHSCRE